MKNYLTVDVEDYFQVSAFADTVSPGDWDAMEHRVENNTGSILRILERHGVRATFFVVGWIAERHPEIVHEIIDYGHEIGCHSYWHRPIYELDPETFREDTFKAKAILEKIANRRITAYRAPSYSITKKSLWALDILKEAGFTTDSSIFPIWHDTYGIPGSPRFPYTHAAQQIDEYPISTAVFFGRNIPIAGGGYFRLFPYWFSRLALKRINQKDGKPFIFYLHPWEIDTGQPRFRQARFTAKLRHYNNLGKTKGRFERLLNDFDFVPLPQERTLKEMVSIQQAG
jgi:polysaccharide deacetylase family protein (PEP-CTERM system associated)